MKGHSVDFSTKKLQKEVDAIYKIADTSTQELRYALAKQFRELGDKEIAEQGAHGYTLCTPCEEYLHMVLWIKDGNNNLCFAINAAKKDKQHKTHQPEQHQSESCQVDLTEKEIEDDSL